MIVDELRKSISDRGSCMFGRCRRSVINRDLDRRCNFRLAADMMQMYSLRNLVIRLTPHQHRNSLHGAPFLPHQQLNSLPTPLLSPSSSSSSSGAHRPKCSLHYEPGRFVGCHRASQLVTRSAHHSPSFTGELTVRN